MYNEADIKSLVEKFIEMVSEEFPLKSLYLFGSYAKGIAAEYSDIDIAVVSDNFEGSRFFDRKKLIKYLLEVSTDIEVHPYKTEDFTEADPFVREIIRTGKKYL